MTTLTSFQEYEDLMARTGFSILLFGTSTCGACSALTQKIDRWCETHPEVGARYISIDDHPDIAAQNQVLSAPTLLVFAEGKLFLERVGIFSLEEVFGRLERYLELSDGSEEQNGAASAANIGKVATQALLTTAVAASMSAALSEPPNVDAMHLPEPVPIVQRYEVPSEEPPVEATPQEMREAADERLKRILKFLRYALFALAIVASIVFGALKGCASCTATTLAPRPDQGSEQGSVASHVKPVNDASFGFLLT